MTVSMSEDNSAEGLQAYAAPDVLWSKGYSQFCDFRGSDAYRLDATESHRSSEYFRRHYAGAHGLVWVRLGTGARDGLPCDLDSFAHGALPTIRRPFALITTDGDLSVPGELPKSTVSDLLECPWLVSWHTQNYDGYPHSKLGPIPIGLDLHTPRASMTPSTLVAQLEEIMCGRRPLDQLPLRVFCDFGFSNDERRSAVAVLSPCGHIDRLPARLAQEALWHRYAEYPFVLSVRGNGLDCHRTWELLYLGCIVITKSSSLDPLFDDLPVVVVKDWDEVADRTNLADWLQRYNALTHRNYVWKRLDPHRYIEPIRAEVQARNNSASA